MKRDKLKQEWNNRRKVLIAAIRLKQSLVADNIINDVLDGEYDKFWKSVQLGVQPDSLDVKKSLGVK